MDFFGRISQVGHALTIPYPLLLDGTTAILIRIALRKKVSRRFIGVP